MRYLRTTIFMLVIVVSLLIANTLSRAATGDRPALEMIEWGEEYFEYPEWSLTVIEKDEGATGTWTSTGHAFSRRYLPEYEPKSGDELDEIIDDDYLEETMENNYKNFEETERCTVSDVLIIEMEAESKTQEDIEYTVRQWFWSDEDGWVDLFTAFSEDEEEEFEDLLSDILGKIARCK